MRLYSYFRSTSSYRVRIALALKGIDYEYVPVNLSPSALAQNDLPFAAVSPLRQVPVLEWQDNGRAHRLTQSAAIIEYLEERFPDPRIFPESLVARARAREVVEVVNSGIQPHHNSGTLARLRERFDEPGARRWAREAIEKGLHALEALSRAVSPRGFFFGPSPSVADVFVVPQLYAARRFGVDLAAFPRLLEIDACAGEREAFRAAAPERQVDAASAATASIPGGSEA